MQLESDRQLVILQYCLQMIDQNFSVCLPFPSIFYGFLLLFAFTINPALRLPSLLDICTK